MKRFTSFVSSPAFAALLFAAGVLLFNWPLLSIQGDRGGVPLFLYIFLIWAILIALLLLMGTLIARTDDPDRKE